MVGGWILRQDYAFPHPRTGKRIRGAIYHKGFLAGMPLDTQQQEGAKVFRTKAEAIAHRRAHLQGKGYRLTRLKKT